MAGSRPMRSPNRCRRGWSAARGWAIAATFPTLCRAARMKRGLRDAVVVGGGVVGAACALALAKLGLDVALKGRGARTAALGRGAARPACTPSRPTTPRCSIRSPRVRDPRSAPNLPAHARGRVGRRRTRDRCRCAGPARTRLDRRTRPARRPAVGGVCPRPGSKIFQPCEAQSLARRTLAFDSVWIRASMLKARIAVAADGGDSALRALANIPADAHDYRQSSVVAYVETASPHEGTAWRRFLPGGCWPSALRRWLEFDRVEPAGGLKPRAMLALDDAAFDRALTTDTFYTTPDDAVGHIERAAFPLRRQLRATPVRGPRAAGRRRVVHPLAGRGETSACATWSRCAASIANAQSRRLGWDAPPAAARWARQRHSGQSRWRRTRSTRSIAPTAAMRCCRRCCAAVRSASPGACRRWRRRSTRPGSNPHPSCRNGCRSPRQRKHRTHGRRHARRPMRPGLGSVHPTGHGQGHGLVRGGAKRSPAVAPSSARR